MIAEVKFYCGDLMSGIRAGAYELSEGTTVEGLLDSAQQEACRILNDSERNSLVFLVNGRPATWETVLVEGDNLKVLYKILGG